MNLKEKLSSEVASLLKVNQENYMHSLIYQLINLIAKAKLSLWTIGLKMMARNSYQDALRSNYESLTILPELEECNASLLKVKKSFAAIFSTIVY